MKKIKLAMVGLGRAGVGMHLPNLIDKNRLEEKYEIAAVCDIEPDRCEEMKEKYGCRVYSKIEDLVKDKDIDIIDIATRSCDHFKHAKTALEAGFTVHLEKPITLTGEQARILFEIAERDGKKRLFINHNRRFEERFMQIRRIIDSGILGNVYYVRRATGSYERRCDWQTLSQYGGGQLLNWGPHLVDQALQFCDGSYKSMDAKLCQVAAAGDCEDFVKVVFTGANDRIVEIEISGATALPTPMYVVYGSRGTLIDKGNTFTMKYLPKDYVMPDIVASPDTPEGAKFHPQPPLPFITEDVKWDDYIPLDRLWDCLYDAYMHGKEYPIKSEEAIKVVETIEEIKNSTSIIRTCDKMTKSI